MAEKFPSSQLNEIIRKNAFQKMQCALPNKESKADNLDSIPVDVLA